MMSFTAISSPLSDAAMNQNGENSLDFQSTMKKTYGTKIKHVFAEMFKIVW